ncbi:MAG: 4Fe-4S binding protein [Spirochaetes bacterium]|nr:4Fe-4S binding protein [Spirochaetota bacterium]
MKTNSTGRSTKFPAIDPKLCKKCNRCIEICPKNAIRESSNNCCAKCVKYCMTMEVPCSPELIVFDYELCDSCGECMSACPHDAIYWFDGIKDA